jgi:hypothetical protein
METKILSPKPNSNSNKGLRSHFDRAVVLLEEKAALAADITEWRDQARSDGLDAAALLLRDSRGRASSPLGAALDIIVEENK